jgi:hypothetical protein
MKPIKMSPVDFDCLVENHSTSEIADMYPYGVVIDTGVKTLDEKIEDFFNEENYLEAFGHKLDSNDLPMLDVPNNQNLKQFLNQFLNYINQ